MLRRKSFTTTLLFFILIFFIFSALALLTKDPVLEKPQLGNGYADLTKFDFSTKLADLPESNFLYYPRMLYTPDDSKQGRIPVEPPAALNSSENKTRENYGTYHMLLALPRGITYGISAYSAMYSQRLFINGVELSTVGTPGTSAETTVSKTKHYTVYFTPQADQTEILVQVSSFQHTDGGGLFGLSLGKQELITARDFSALTRIYLLIGCILMTFLFFMGMFFFFNGKPPFLWFALCCLNIGVRMLIIEEKAIMNLFPDLDWNISLKLEYLTVIALVFCFIRYMNSRFPGLLNRFIRICLGLCCGLYGALVLLTNPAIYTKYLFVFQISGACFLIYATAMLIYYFLVRKESHKTEYLLLFAGVLCFVPLSILDIYHHVHWGYRLPLGLTNSGMMLFILANMVSLVTGFARTEIERDEALQAEQESQEKNRLMESLNQVRTEFLQNLSHEMRTPLTIMSSYAGLTSRQIHKNAVDEETLHNLETVKQEASRLAELVERLKDISLERQRQLALTNTDAKSLLDQAANFCTPICRKNENHIAVTVRPEYIPLRVNANSLFQVLVNLIINANRHSKKDTILLSASPILQKTQVQFSITDHGEGIAPELLPKVWERHVSGDGSTGLGLAICQDIITEHGGVIEIESMQGKGTVIRFTLPYEKEEKSP